MRPARTLFLLVGGSRPTSGASRSAISFRQGATRCQDAAFSELLQMTAMGRPTGHSSIGAHNHGDHAAFALAKPCELRRSGESSPGPAEAGQSKAAVVPCAHRHTCWARALSGARHTLGAAREAPRRRREETRRHPSAGRCVSGDAQVTPAEPRRDLPSRRGRREVAAQQDGACRGRTNMVPRSWRRRSGRARRARPEAGLR